MASTLTAHPLTDDEQISCEEKALELERNWLFEQILPRALVAIREGLEECSNLLHNANITLPISTRETEKIKGIMTRQSSHLVKGDLLIKLNKLQLRLSIPNGKQIHLQQIEDVISLVHYSIESTKHDLFHDTAKRVIGDVSMNLSQALDALSKYPSSNAFPLGTVDPESFRPELPKNTALDIYIQDASLVSEIRTLQPRISDNFLTSLRKSTPSEGGFVRFQGQDYKVIEHVRVESQDPALIAISAKLTALKHSVQEVQRKLRATQTT